MTSPYAYGLWTYVAINSIVVLLFAISFFRPQSKRDWRTFGAFSAFIVALFTEMYGFPLTIYLLSGWLSSRFPQLNLFSHDAGHLWQAILGWQGDPHGGPLHLVSDLLILAGFFLLAASWRVLLHARRNHQVAQTGPYARMRHPQYVGLMLIMIGFLVQWPTLPTLVMFPILVWMYIRLAKREEKEVREEFGDSYARYAQATPGFFPRLTRKASTTTAASGEPGS